MTLTKLQRLIDWHTLTETNARLKEADKVAEIKWQGQSDWDKGTESKLQRKGDRYKVT